MGYKDSDIISWNALQWKILLVACSERSQSRIQSFILNYSPNNKHAYISCPKIAKGLITVLKYYIDLCLKIFFFVHKKCIKLKMNKPKNFGDINQIGILIK